MHPAFNQQIASQCYLVFEISIQLQNFAGAYVWELDRLIHSR